MVVKMRLCRLDLKRRRISLLTLMCLCLLLLLLHVLTQSSHPHSSLKDDLIYTSRSQPLILNGKTYYLRDDSWSTPRRVDEQTSDSNMPFNDVTGITSTLKYQSTMSRSNQSSRIGVRFNNYNDVSHSNQSVPSPLFVPVHMRKDSNKTLPETKDLNTNWIPQFSINKTIDKQTIMILFTTFKSSSDRVYPQSQTVLNWAQFRPWVQPVLYSPDKDGVLVNLALANGWHIYEELESNQYGTPLLKPMFRHAQAHYNCSFYGFANGDILFNNGLVDTIKFMSLQRKHLNATMVVGQRWNFPYYKYMSNVTRLGNIWPTNRVNEIRGQSKLFSRDAEDYFLTSRDYPWHKIRDVVIGRPGYDNYLVSMSIKLNVSTVDATSTITALHITLNGSIFAGARNVDNRYNKKLIGKFNYNSGITSSTRFVTSRKKSLGGVVITQRWDPVQKAAAEKQKLKKKQMEKQKKEQEGKNQNQTEKDKPS